MLLTTVALATGCAEHTNVARALLSPPGDSRQPTIVVRPDTAASNARTLIGPAYHSPVLGDVGSSSFRIERDADAAASSVAPVRVMLALANGPFQVWSPADLEVELYPGDRPTSWSNRLAINAHGDTLVVDGQQVGSDIRLRSTGSDLGVQLQGKRYAGDLRFLAENGKVRIINELPLEEYLRGVVPAEVSPTWQPEALKTIAVAARTYALFQMEQSSNRGWDVTDTIDTQVYGGLSAADPRSDRAVRDTEGQILIYDGAPILATYHASSGGHTEDASRVWSKDVPYLRAQVDPAPDANTAPWRASVAMKEIERLLKSIGYRVSKISDVSVIERTPSGRAETVRVRHSRGFIDLAAAKLKALLGGQRIHSTLFQIARTKTAVLFSGKGYGHGVGLSQLGAASLANDGVAYQQILYAYYPGTQLAHLQ